MAQLHLTAVLSSYLAWGLLASLAVMTQIPDLQTLRWNQRVVLLFAPSHDDRELKEQTAKMDAVEKELAERDVKVFEVTGDSAEAQRLQAQFDVQPGRFTVVLVGKDGGRKLKKEMVVEPALLFRKIDAMPMRRDEMRKRQGRDEL